MYTDIIASLQRRTEKQHPELDRIRLQLDVPNFNVEDTALLLERTVTAEVALSATDNTADPVSYVFTYCYTWGLDLVGRRCHKCGKVCTLIKRDQCNDCGGAEPTFDPYINGAPNLVDKVVRADIQQDEHREGDVFDDSHGS